jgi:fibronectin type 3 domain-containing protein
LVPEEKTIDLSWQPDTEEDLAGYIVYRAESDGDWKRISGAQPLTGPAYRDAAVEAGHSYRYAVSAIDLTGHESKRSAEAQETVPNP